MDIAGFGPSYTPRVVTEVAHAAAVIATLNSRISRSLVQSAWQTRAAWAGYARALQLEGHEVEEIDLFSWGCRVTIPGRPLRATNRGEYEAFAPWQDMLGSSDPFAWRDALPKAVELPAEAADHPPLVRALEQIRLSDAKIERNGVQCAVIERHNRLHSKGAAAAGRSGY
ncbi:hypothetical protein [Sphingobium yanoikuyae]|uniref:hypothetical protein n=1 Tax=Sphingobium yanoikuyae TaxID=13690 RepID=UPI0019D0FB49|nr:hypothetical protein [Sphingobium yanoikuyae]